MKDLEKVSTMLQQFIQESVVEVNKLDEELGLKKEEQAAKQKEIEDVQDQMNYLEMLKMQLQDKLELLEQEKAILDALVEEKEMEVRRNKLENIVENMDKVDDIQTNDGEEMIDEGK